MFDGEGRERGPNYNDHGGGEEKPSRAKVPKIKTIAVIRANRSISALRTPKGCRIGPAVAANQERDQEERARSVKVEECEMVRNFRILAEKESPAENERVTGTPGGVQGKAAAHRGGEDNLEKRGLFDSNGKKDGSQWSSESVNGGSMGADQNDL